MSKHLFIKSIASLLFGFILAGCGGGGGSSSGSGTVTPTNVTGKFVDATVVGIAYKCGGSTTVSGTTNANGEYTCQAGQAVAFYVGDILIGSVSSPLAVVTPLDLVGTGATPSNATVANIVRFLMSISSTDPATGTITITPAVVAAAAGKTVDFTAVSPTAIDTLIPTLRLGAIVYSSAQATSHVTSSINGLFAGNYAGTYSGAASGSWSLTVNANGSVTGTSTAGVITGNMATTLSTGSTYGFTGTAGGVPWSGTLNISTKVFSGTWNDGAGSSGTWTGTASATGGASTPTAPTGVAASLQAASVINVTWSPVSGATGYNVYRSTTSPVAISTTNKINASPVVDTGLGDSGLAASTQYFYKVTAINAAGEGSPSGETSATTPGAVATPTVTGFSPTTGAVGITVTITGTNFNSYPTTPMVMFGTTPSPSITAAGSGNSVTAVVPNGLALGNHSITIGAVNGTLNGITGTPLTVGTFTVTAPVVVVPAAPTGVMATAFSATQIDLSWTAVTGATKYNIYQATATGVIVSAANNVGTKTIPFFSSTPLYGATPYYFVVTAQNAAGESVGSAEVTATTKAVPVGVTVPTGVGTPSQTTGLAGQIGIYQGAFPGTDAINVYRSTMPNVAITPANLVNPRPLGIVSAYGSSWSSYTDVGLAAGTTYYYKTTQVNAAGEGPGSTELIARTALASIGAGAGLTLSPAYVGVATISNRIPYESNQGGVFASSFAESASRELRISFIVDAINGDRLAVTRTDTTSGINQADLDAPNRNCAITTAAGLVTCASLGIALDRVAGSIIFSNTPMKSFTGNTLFTISGELNFTPF